MYISLDVKHAHVGTKLWEDRYGLFTAVVHRYLDHRTLVQPGERDEFTHQKNVYTTIYTHTLLQRLV